jgi:hypothetical protein
MNHEFHALAALGAGDFEHLDGSLLKHLSATRDLLASWGSSKELQDAGLYHAAYGTQVFLQALVAKDQRRKIANIIGQQAEHIVYQYCACDRDYFWPKIGTDTQAVFRNRFTSETYVLDDSMMRNICQLSVANEIEIAVGNAKFVVQHGAFLAQLFSRMEPYLTPQAYTMTTQIFSAQSMDVGDKY